MHFEDTGVRPVGGVLQRFRGRKAASAALAMALAATLAVPGWASAASIPQVEAGVPAQMDSRYTETVQLPVTLYDYGRLVDGEWLTTEPTVLNDGIPGAIDSETAPADMPKAMRFWDTEYMNWDPAGDPSSMFDSDGEMLKAGIFSWGLFEREFTDWSSIIAVPSRDLFGKDAESCYYGGEVFKQVYEDVMMEFSYDPDTNSYHYSSNESSSTFDGSGLLKKSELGPDATEDDVGFWPFGQGNVHFGLVMEFDFYLPSEKYLASNDYYFAFSGDDDLVVYIDDQLTLDLGGCHMATAGYIDFSNEIVVYGYCAHSYHQTSFEASVADSEIEFNRSGFDEAGVDWNMETFGYVTFEELGIDLDNGADHDFKLAFMERGGSASNLMIEMNMELRASVDYEIVGDVEPDPSITDPVPVEDDLFCIGDSYTAQPGLTTSDSGYTFSGWYTDPECTDPWVDGTALSAENTTLYGRWYYGEAVKTADPSPGQTVLPSQRIVYTVSYVNEKDHAEKVRMTDEVPLGTSYVTGSAFASPEEGGTVSEDGIAEDGSGYVECTWERVDPGEEVSLVFSVIVGQVAAGTVIENHATVEIDDGAHTYTTPLVEHVVGEPLLSIEKTSDPPDGSTVEAGDNVVYEVTVRNESDAAVTDIVVTDPVPEGTTFVEGSISCWIENSAAEEDPADDTAAQLGDAESVDVAEEDEFWYTAYESDGVVTVEISSLDPGRSAVIVFAVEISEMESSGTREIANVAYVETPSMPGGPMESNQVLLYQSLDEAELVSKGTMPKTGDALLPILIALGCVGIGVVVLLVTLRAGTRESDEDMM